MRGASRKVISLREVVKKRVVGVGTQFSYTFDLGDDWFHLCTFAGSPYHVDAVAAGSRESRGSHAQAAWSRVRWAWSTDNSVWAITCLFTRTGHRRKGISRALAAAAVDFARERGARAVEAYPVTVAVGTWGEDHPGYAAVYAVAGLEPVHEPSKRRLVMRIDF